VTKKGSNPSAQGGHSEKLYLGNFPAHAHRKSKKEMRLSGKKGVVRAEKNNRCGVLDRAPDRIINHRQGGEVLGKRKRNRGGGQDRKPTLKS